MTPGSTLRGRFRAASSSRGRRRIPRACCPHIRCPRDSNLVLLRRWEHDTENAALPKLALQFNSSALVLDRPLRDGQPQAVSAVGPGTGSVHSVETVEDFCLMIRRDARPLVSDFDAGVA